MEENKPVLPHTLLAENRNKLHLTGVTDVGHFNEEGLLLITSLGELNVGGSELQVTKLDLESGEVSVEGKIVSMSYSDNVRRNGGFFSKMFS